MGHVEQLQAAQSRAFAAHGLEAKTRFVAVPTSGRAQVIEAGEGPPLLFVIGGGAPAALWTPLMARLDGYRRIAVDRPGFGLTPPVAHRREGMRELARSFIAEVLDALELEAATIVASSMGAWWATRLALGSPERVAAMVHVGCPALLLETSAPLPVRLMGVRGLGRLMARLEPASRRQARRTLEMMGDPPGDGARDAAMIHVMASAAALPEFGDAWADLLHAFVRPRGPRPGMAITAEDLRRLHCPLLYVWGDRDPFGGQEVGRRAAEIAPRAGFAPIPGGHVPWISDAEEVAAPIRAFLEASPGRAGGARAAPG